MKISKRKFGQQRITTLRKNNVRKQNLYTRNLRPANFFRLASIPQIIFCAHSHNNAPAFFMSQHDLCTYRVPDILCNEVSSSLWSSSLLRFIAVV